MNLREKIRTIPDFPKKGILFYDITPLLADPQAFSQAIDELAKPFLDQNIDLILAAESRGFIFGAPLARRLGCGFVPIRKPGKLPSQVIAEEYELEYGTNKLEMHEDSIIPGQRILLVDDLLATGGTIKACCNMVESLKGQIVGLAFLIELSFLNGRQLLKEYPIHCLMTFDEG